MPISSRFVRSIVRSFYLRLCTSFLFPLSMAADHIQRSCSSGTTRERAHIAHTSPLAFHDDDDAAAALALLHRGRRNNRIYYDYCPHRFRSEKWSRLAHFKTPLRLKARKRTLLRQHRVRKKWSLEALNGMHSVFAIREREDGQKSEGGITDSVCSRDFAIIAVAVRVRGSRVVRLRSVQRRRCWMDWGLMNANEMLGREGGS